MPRIPGIPRSQVCSTLFPLPSGLSTLFAQALTLGIYRPYNAQGEKRADIHKQGPLEVGLHVGPRWKATAATHKIETGNKKAIQSGIHFSQMPPFIVGHNWLQPVAIIHSHRCTCYWAPSRIPILKTLWHRQICDSNCNPRWLNGITLQLVDWAPYLRYLAAGRPSANWIPKASIVWSLARPSLYMLNWNVACQYQIGIPCIHASIIYYFSINHCIELGFNITT